ncbi:MAG: hypothetical protein ACERKZ_05690 [Lachnotalea sp.]
MNPIERMYQGKCTVIELQSVTDPITKITSKIPIIVLENQPCKLSFSSTQTTKDSDGANKVTLIPKLFISPSIEIKSGSKITVVQDERMYEFCKSGIPAVFSSHQEIQLELFQKYS